MWSLCVHVIVVCVRRWTRLCVHVIVGSLVCTCDFHLRAQVIVRLKRGLCVYMWSWFACADDPLTARDIATVPHFPYCPPLPSAMRCPGCRCFCCVCSAFWSPSASSVQPPRRPPSFVTWRRISDWTRCNPLQMSRASTVSSRVLKRKTGSSCQLLLTIGVSIAIFNINGMITTWFPAPVAAVTGSQPWACRVRRCGPMKRVPAVQAWDGGTGKRYPT